MSRHYTKTTYITATRNRTARFDVIALCCFIVDILKLGPFRIFLQLIFNWYFTDIFYVFYSQVTVICAEETDYTNIMPPLS